MSTSNNDMTAALAPCPFCGQHKLFLMRYEMGPDTFVHCEPCGARAPVSRWNDRPSIGIRDLKRDEAYDAIDSERQYQDEGRGNAQRHEGAPKHLSQGEVILCMEKCLSDARAAWYSPAGGATCLPFIRKVAALGVQAMENYGAPKRDLV